MVPRRGPGASSGRPAAAGIDLPNLGFGGPGTLAYAQTANAGNTPTILATPPRSLSSSTTWPEISP
jgi:hypothetical protein